MEIYVWILSLGFLVAKIFAGIAIIWICFYDTAQSAWKLPWHHDYFHLQEIARTDGSFMAIMTFVFGLLAMCSMGIAFFFISSSLYTLKTLTISPISKTSAILFTFSMLLAMFLWLLMYLFAITKKD